ncbi:Solute carrier family 40 member [Dirofilaria immitis]
MQISVLFWLYKAKGLTVAIYLFDISSKKSCSAVLHFMQSDSEQRRRKLPSASLSGLYLAYAISCIGDRLWTFALILILEYVGGIRLVCFSQLLEEIIIMTFSSVIGNWMDNHTRKRGIITVLAINNTNVAISATLLAACITISRMGSLSLLWHILYITCIILSIITCSLGCLASEMEKMAFTKDWIVVIIKKDELSLSAANAWMKTIDLSSSILSPATAGYIISSISYRFACMIFVVWNLLSVFIEAYIITKVYNAVPELSIRESSSHDSCRLCKITRPVGLMAGHLEKYRRCFWYYWCIFVFSYRNFFFGKEIRIDWADLLEKGNTENENIEFFLKSQNTIRQSEAQNLALYICIASIWLPGSPYDPVTYFRKITFANWWQQLQNSFVFINNKNQSETGSNDIDWSTWTSNGHSIISAFTLLLGIAVARLGLYIADLSISQIMQETVPERERNTVFGVQYSVSQFFSVFKDVMTIIIPDPKTFGILIIISILFVFSGFLCFCYYLLTVIDYNKEKIKLSNIKTEENHMKRSEIISAEAQDSTKKVSHFLDIATAISDKGRENP